MAQTPVIYLQDGESVDYTPSAAVAAGAVVLIGTIPHVAKTPIAALEHGVLTSDGVFRFPKDASVFAAGDAVYWNAAGDPNGGDTGSGAATSTPSAYLLGTVVPDGGAATGIETVDVQLTPAKRTATIAGSVTATDITGEDSTLAIAGKDAASSGAGGTATVQGGAGHTAGNGGAASVTGGTAATSGTGGAATLAGGAAGAAGTGGAAAVVGGTAASGNGPGGAASITGGAGKGTQAGGAVSAVGGVGGATGAGGAIAVTGGAGGSSSGTGGAIAITGGAGTAGNANGGAVSITGGLKNGSGANGAVGIADDKACTVTIGYASGILKIVGLPTSDPAVANQVYVSTGALKLSAG